MNKFLFVSISAKAHKLTKAYRKRFKCTYSVQFGIFFKLIYNMYKNNTATEKVTTVKQKVNGVVQKVKYYVKGKWLNIQYTTDSGNGIDPCPKDFWTLAGRATNIIPLLI